MMDLWAIGSSDDETKDLIAILRVAFSTAEEAQLAHPETISALRQWCKVEEQRFRNRPERSLTVEQEIIASLQRSPYWPFWESLQAEQEVRWTGTRNATYFVVDPQPVTQIPDGNFGRHGYYIELRRHSGKTFWTHIGQVRPL